MIKKHLSAKVSYKMYDDMANHQSQPEQLISWKFNICCGLDDLNDLQINYSTPSARIIVIRRCILPLKHMKY